MSLLYLFSRIETHNNLISSNIHLKTLDKIFLKIYIIIRVYLSQTESTLRGQGLQWSKVSNIQFLNSYFQFTFWEEICPNIVYAWKSYQSFSDTLLEQKYSYNFNI